MVEGAWVARQRRLRVPGGRAEELNGAGSMGGSGKVVGSMGKTRKEEAASVGGIGSGGIPMRMWLAAYGWNLGGDEWLVRLEI